MTYYATTDDCLRSHILAYFGESAPHFCGNCSNCTTQFESSDITIPAQKVLSCVYRLEQRGRRFGKIMVINILKGSKSEKVLKEGLENLSTYGIMAETDIHRLRTILDYLIEKEYLAQEGEEYPVLRLGPRWEEILRQKKPLSMMLPKERERKKPHTGLLPGTAGGSPGAADEMPGEFHEDLFVQLKDLRNRLAQKARVPAYIIFSDATLRDMCRKLPQTPDQFLTVSGVGTVKMEKYGPFFLDLIKAKNSDTRGS
jgi:ATP-dependent DNA helicase RecQ